MIIKFDKVMFTDFDLSHLNESNIDMYIHNPYHQHIDGFNVSKLNFTWYVTSFVNMTMKVKLTFRYPSYISHYKVRDSLLVNIRNETLFISVN